MIENIRKYTGLMIVVLVLLFLGLVFLDGGAISRALGGKPVMEVNDQPVSQKEFRRQVALIQLATMIPGNFPLPRETRILASHYLGDAAIENDSLTPGAIIMEMARFLQVGYPYGPTDEGRFVTNRISVQKAGLDYGVTPGDTEVESFVKNVLFADPEGNYDQVAYEEFLKNRVANLGGTSGFIEYIRDLLTAQNLAKLIGGGLAPEMESVRLIYDTDEQIINGQQIALDTALFEGKAQPSEEEIKAYFEENQENYQSDELRKVSYVLIEPDWEKTLEEVNAEKERARKAAEEKARKEEEALKKTKEAKESEKETDEAESPTEGNKDSAPAENETSTPDAPTESTETSASPTETESTEEAGAAEEAPAPVEEPAAPADEPAAPADPDETAALSSGRDDSTLPTITPPPSQEDLQNSIDDLVKEAESALNDDLPEIPEIPELPKSPQEQLNAMEKRKAVEALAPRVDELYDELVNNRGEDFEGIAKKLGFEVKTSDFFSKDDPPKLFKAFVRNSRVGKVVDDVFQSPTDGDPDELLSEPLQTADGWIVFRFDEAQEAVPLSFQEARTQVTIDLKKKMARESLIKKANELRDQLVTALEEDQSFEEAAKELEQQPTELEDLTAGQTLSFGGRPQKMPNPPAFEAAKYTNPGEIAPLTFTPSEEEANRALIIYVDQREVVKDPEYLSELETAFQQRSRFHTLIAFENWLNDRYNESNVIPPKVEKQ